MWSLSYSALSALDYLSNLMYAELPVSLWDRNLWMYGCIEDWISSYFSQWKRRDFDIYVNRDGSSQTGLALVRGDQAVQKAEVLADARTAEDVASLYDIIRNKYTYDISLVVRIKELAEQVASLIPGLMVIPEKVKLYATQKVDHPTRGIELTEDHQPLLWQSQWTSFTDLLLTGFRFFGVELAGKIVATAGLWNHTRKHAEIVAVGTDPQYFRKGYAKDACSLALNAGLESSDVVTWSTDIANDPSVKLARSLGFVEYLTTYRIT